MRTVDDCADVRTGDKGDTLILAVLARDEDAYHLLEQQLTTDAVTGHYALDLTGPVVRRLLPGLHALVFTLPGALGGGVTGSPVLDGHGKALSYHLLSLPLGTSSHQDQ
ncbi:AtuA-related protein [Kocuria oceani]|uniref:AtuA-related protein n=1 Tax=Kocuria oceani TaxID=988827 RepID=UPI00403513AC